MDNSSPRYGNSSLLWQNIIANLEAFRDLFVSFTFKGAMMYLALGRDTIKYEEKLVNFLFYPYTHLPNFHDVVTTNFGVGPDIIQSSIIECSAPSYIFACGVDGFVEWVLHYFTLMLLQTLSNLCYTFISSYDRRLEESFISQGTNITSNDLCIMCNRYH